MRIDKLGLRAFGKFHNKTVDLKSGVNVLFGPNEAGKSTIAGFILYRQFYGLPSARSAKDKALRARFIPWGEEDVSGFMDVTDEAGERYRIDRTGEKKVRITSLFTGKDIPLPRAMQPGDYFFGVNEKTFVSTVFVKQSELALSESPKELEDITSRLKNLIVSGDEGVSAEKAAKALLDARREIEPLRGKQGRLEEANQAYFTLLEKRAKAKKDREEISLLRAKQEQLRRKVVGAKRAP